MPISDILVGTPSYRPYTNITPFTVRDGATYLLQLEALKDWWRDTVVPHIDTETGELTEEWKTLTTQLMADWETKQGELTQLVIESVAGIDNKVELAEAAKVASEAAAALAEQYASQAEEIQDVAISTIASDDSSATRGTLDNLYAGLTAFGNLNDVVASGRLSETSLDARFTGKADLEYVETSFTPINSLGISLNKTAGTFTELQEAVNDAASNRVPLYLAGSYVIAESIVLPANTRIIGMGYVTIEQTSSLTPHFTGNAISNVDVTGITLKGLGSDYVNSDAVYGATGFKFTGNCGRINIDNVVFDTIAGSAVFVSTSATKHVAIRNCTVTGAGLGIIGTGNYSAGIVVQDGIQDVVIVGNDISQIGQGLSIGHGSKRITVTDNRFHDTSEHGAYFATSDSYIISGNYFYNTGLLGFKIQNGKAGYTCKNAVIESNILENTGSNSIMITNAIADVMFIENVVIANNTVYDSGDTGIRIDNVSVVKLIGNIINIARFGIRVFKSKAVQLISNTVKQTERTGVLIDNTSLVVFESNVLLNLGILGPEKVGIIVTGIVDGLTLNGNIVDYDSAAQSDGILFGAGNYSRIRILNNYFRGANWGMRTAAAVSGIIDWRNNRAIGGAGTIDGAPSIVPTLPNVALGDLTVAATEMNKIKQILRDQQDAR